MKPTQTIFNRDYRTVTISEKEYNKLLQYKSLALEMRDIIYGGDSE